MSLEVRSGAVSPGEWEGYVASHPRGSLFHLEVWGALVGSVYALPTLRLTVHRGAALAGGVTLFEAARPLTGRFLTTLPYSAHHGAILADDAEARAALVTACRTEARWRRCRFVELKEREPLPGAPAPPVYAHYPLSLAGGLEAAWRRAEGPVRTKVRRARDAGLVVTWEDGVGVGEFYVLYSATMRRLGSPAHPRRFFDALFAHFPDDASVALARRRGQALAAAVVLRWRDWMGLPWAASRVEALALRPNNLLFWSIAERACAEGLTTLDLGRSPLRSGAAHFKRGWGAEERPLAYVCLHPEGRPASPVHPDAPTLRAASAVWRLLPKSLAACFGPTAARWLP